MDEHLLKRADDLARQGQRAAARQIVVNSIVADPRQYRAWVMMAGLVDEPEQAVECLERAVRLRPDLTDLRDMLTAAQSSAAQFRAAPRPDPISGTPPVAVPPPDDDEETKPVLPPVPPTVQLRDLSPEELRPYQEETRPSEAFRTQRIPLVEPDFHAMPTLVSHRTEPFTREELQRALRGAAVEEEGKGKGGSFWSRWLRRRR